jgi:hypothetical protein
MAARIVKGPPHCASTKHLFYGKGRMLLYSFQLQLMWSGADDCGLVAVNVVSVAIIVVPMHPLVAMNLGQKLA